MTTSLDHRVPKAIPDSPPPAVNLEPLDREEVSISFVDGSDVVPAGRFRSFLHDKGARCFRSKVCRVCVYIQIIMLVGMIIAFSVVEVERQRCLRPEFKRESVLLTDMTNVTKVVLTGSPGLLTFVQLAVGNSAKVRLELRSNRDDLALYTVKTAVKEAGVWSLDVRNTLTTQLGSCPTAVVNITVPSTKALLDLDLSSDGLIVSLETGSKHALGDVSVTTKQSITVPTGLMTRNLLLDVSGAGILQLSGDIMSNGSLQLLGEESEWPVSIDTIQSTGDTRLAFGSAPVAISQVSIASMADVAASGPLSIGKLVSTAPNRDATVTVAVAKDPLKIVADPSFSGTYSIMSAGGNLVVDNNHVKRSDRRRTGTIYKDNNGRNKLRIISSTATCRLQG